MESSIKVIRSLDCPPCTNSCLLLSLTNAMALCGGNVPCVLVPFLMMLDLVPAHKGSLVTLH